MLSTQNSVIYICVVSLIGVYLLSKTSSFLVRLKQRRLRWLKRHQHLKTFKAEGAPFDESEVEAKRLQQSRAAIERQFSISRRLTIPLIALTFSVLLSIPFLPLVPATAVSSILAILTLCLGFIMRPLLENMIAGLILSSSKLIRLGDTIEISGFYGTIEDISPTHTTVKNWDWRRVVKPNSEMLASELVNHSLQGGEQWAHVDFHLKLDCELDDFQLELLALVQPLEHRTPDTEIDFWVMKLGELSVRCRVAAWASNPADAFYLKEGMNRAILSLMRSHKVASHQYQVGELSSHDQLQRLSVPTRDHKSA